jgi:hypothetical protein
VYSEAEDGHQGLVDAPLLVGGHPVHEVTEPPSIHGSDLLDQDAGGLAEQFDLGAERGGLALRDVGATSTTEHGSNSLAWTITP